MHEASHNSIFSDGYSLKASWVGLVHKSKPGKQVDQSNWSNNHKLLLASRKNNTTHYLDVLWVDTSSNSIWCLTTT